MSVASAGWRRRCAHAVALLVCAVLASVLAAGAAVAHEISMAELQLREVARGDFLVQWGAGEKAVPADSLTPLWPEGCSADGNLLRCGAAGLTGTLGMRGVGDKFSAALVKVYWQGGESRVYTLTAGQPTARLYGAADDPRGRAEVAAAYGVLGVEHILNGVDHLLFVIGLLFLVGFQRRLVWTITAFTVAHSLTLASAALGWLTLRPAPVEACIALSIALVAAEALRTRQTLSRRWPALLAFLFGLVHGLGFAGALQDIGLPPQHLATALLTFNLGVEAGQLMTVAACWLIVKALTTPASRLQRWAPALRTPALYAIGGVAAYWSLQRLSVIIA